VVKCSLDTYGLSAMDHDDVDDLLFSMYFKFGYLWNLIQLQKNIDILSYCFYNEESLSE